MSESYMNVGGSNDVLALLQMEPVRDGFVLDEAHKSIDVWWGGYEYSIELPRIGKPEQCEEWLRQMCSKAWEGTTESRVDRFIFVLARRFRWSGKAILDLLEHGTFSWGEDNHGGIRGDARRARAA
jgi:hypothetical protein